MALALALVVRSPMNWSWPEPRSLQRHARSVRAELEELNRFERIQRAAGRLLSKLFHDYRLALLLAIPCFGVAFLPIGWSFHPFSNPQTAINYLSTLWQVEAAALALALAVVIFIFQAVYSAKPRPSLRDLAERIFLPALFYSGLFGIALVGIVLLDAGHGAPGGWAATWALLWGGLLVLGLIGLFAQMLHVIEPDRLYRHWLQSIEDEMNKHVEADVLRRIAASVLQEICANNHLQFSPMWGSSLAPQLDEVKAKKAGVVTDIDLRRIRKAGRESEATQVALTHGGDRPVVCVELGAQVAEDTVLMRLARVMFQFVRPEKAFKIKAVPPDVELYNLLDDLHDEALRLIRTGSPNAYRRVNEVYERLLLVHPKTWARYQQQYDPGLAAGMGLFEWTTLDRLLRPLEDEIEQAIASGDFTIAQEALNLAIEVARQASRLDPAATGLIDRILGVFVYGVSEVIRGA